ncbi:MAG: hypothetical protein AAFP19_10725 [Bacteroidota bacterium]
MLKIGYLLLSLLMTIIVYLMGHYAINQSTAEAEKNKKRASLLLGLCLWHLYLFLLGSSGYLTDLSFPPRFVTMMILPAFLFTGLFLARHRKSQWIQSIPPYWLAAFQSFRLIIESLFVFTLAAGLLHKNVTIEGYNYDMVFASTAPIVAFLAYRSKVLPKNLLKIWNYAGLLVIASIIILFTTTIYFPAIYGPDTAPFPNDFGWYPYILVPGFLMPLAVFIHILSLVQLSAKQ